MQHISVRRPFETLRQLELRQNLSAPCSIRPDRQACYGTKRRPVADAFGAKPGIAIRRRYRAIDGTPRQRCQIDITGTACRPDNRPPLAVDHSLFAVSSRSFAV